MLDWKAGDTGLIPVSAPKFPLPMDLLAHFYNPILLGVGNDALLMYSKLYMAGMGPGKCSMQDSQ